MTKLKSPHLLLASSNPQKLRANIAHIITRTSLQRIDGELDRNVIALFRLGESHYAFARSLQVNEWRQKISRFYYGAYNVQRAIRLKVEGAFSTDSTDHKVIGQLPDTFPNRATYGNQLTTLREDRNLADYSHDSTSTDLVISVADAETLVFDFIQDSRAFLLSLGLTL